MIAAPYYRAADVARAPPWADKSANHGYNLVFSANVVERHFVDRDTVAGSKRLAHSSRCCFSDQPEQVFSTNDISAGGASELLISLLQKDLDSRLRAGCRYADSLHLEPRCAACGISAGVPVGHTVVSGSTAGGGCVSTGCFLFAMQFLLARVIRVVNRGGVVHIFAFPGPPAA